MNRSLILVLLLGCLAGSPEWAVAQSVALTGHVLDATTGKPLAFANVYLNGTTRGTVTNEQGAFSLMVPLGTVEVVASFLGYQTKKHTLRLVNQQPRSASFQLKPDNRLINAVTVRAKSKDRTWQRQFRRFREQLLGPVFGNQCVITNSHVLTFREENGHLYATAAEPLIIENNALGYRLTYDLLYFDGAFRQTYYGGASRFEELPAADERQVRHYKRNRMLAYQGSLRHLLASLVARKYEENGFLVYLEDITKPLSIHNEPPTLMDATLRYKRLIPVRPDSIIRPGPLSFERQLVTSWPLVVFYTRATSAFSPYRDARYAYSHVDLPGNMMQFTTDGWVTVPNGMEVKGSLADDRLSTLLPADWHPDQTSTGSPAEMPLVVQGQLLPPDARLGRLTDAFTKRYESMAPSVFVHIDKPLYATGDRLWLSAYLLDTPTGQLPIGETALHVELLHPSGKLVQHQWLRVVDGRAAGDFRLSDTLSSGTYRLRAYTDEDDSQLGPAFERNLTVYNILQGATVASSGAAAQPVDVQILPEGGRWLAGVPTRFGVKAVGPDGRGRRVSGLIRNQQGVEIKRFVTNELGMGSVDITALPGYRYVAVVATADGYQQQVRLPSPATNGLVLSADAVSDSARLRLRITGADTLRADSAYLLIQQRGRLIDQRKVLLERGQAQLNLPVINYPPGLLQLTLFDAAAQPQAERLVFVPEREPVTQVGIQTDKRQYTPRERVSLRFAVTEEGEPVAAMLSASVTDYGQVPIDSMGADIRTHWLLTGELRGRVEQPGSYLRDTTPAGRQALDNLLLTQGWRRVSGTPDGKNFLGGVSVTGRIVDAAGNPLPGAQVMLAATGDKPFMLSAGANEQGRFRLAGLPVADTVNALVQLTDHNFKNYKPTDVRLIPEQPGPSWLPDSLTFEPDWARLKAQLQAAQIRQESNPGLYRDRSVRQLKEVTVRAKRQDEQDAAVRRMSVHSGADAVVKLEGRMTQFANLYEVLRQVPGVSVGLTSGADAMGGYSVVIRGIGTFSSETQPMYLLDGSPLMGDPSTVLLNFSPNDIDRIEVLKNGASAGAYGVRGGNGVIAIYSKRGGSTSGKNANKSGSASFRIIGYPSVRREFYVPRYETDVASPSDTTAVDRRDVLYWKPLVQTDATGKAQVLFPLSDVVRTLQVTVQGVTQDGRPVSVAKLIRLQ